jgi:DNA-binding helix-hairpin-helix protein with protein kinase domain
MTDSPAPTTPPAEPAQATPTLEDFAASRTAPAPSKDSPAPTAAPEPDSIEAIKAEARKWEQRAKENFEKAQQFDSYQESQKTEAQKLTEAKAAAEKAATDAQQELTRYKVAAAKGVPAELLSGADEDEMAASADRLLAFRGAPSVPSFDGGARTPAEGQDMNQLIRRRVRG